MKTSRTQIAKIIADKAIAGVQTKKLSREVGAYLLSEGRISELASLLRDIQADWAEAGYVEVLATSAHPLPASALADIKKQIGKLYPPAKRIIVGEIIDPNIIGGVRLNLANQQLDLSFEAKLNKFKQLTIAGKD